MDIIKFEWLIILIHNVARTDDKSELRIAMAFDYIPLFQQHWYMLFYSENEHAP